ncbi:hypothetical protein BEN47_05740 [Hymenobacter lapidarius]|uniref:STAS domain-containing protein n=1 Tax=Hymenobacter lapidarius TaxID=1908237 RepID=A0A1G1SS44_9BACT|nr:hypothetical protein [Hymenobacter lapidarius]OGX81449.1 hypothetical protein BEN47_05740 [Hymenobacter lapidarius]
MPFLIADSMTETAAPALTSVSLADLTAKQLACLLVAPPPRLLVDCGGLLLPHPLGVCRFVAQLLQMHQRGTRLWLCDVHPALRCCLHRLGLEKVFHLNG